MPWVISTARTSMSGMISPGGWPSSSGPDVVELTMTGGIVGMGGVGRLGDEATGSSLTSSSQRRRRAGQWSWCGGVVTTRIGAMACSRHTPVEEMSRQAITWCGPSGTGGDRQGHDECPVLGDDRPWPAPRRRRPRRGAGRRCPAGTRHRSPSAALQVRPACGETVNVGLPPGPAPAISAAAVIDNTAATSRVAPRRTFMATPFLSVSASASVVRPPL